MRKLQKLLFILLLAPLSAVAVTTIEINFLYVHGVQNCQAGRTNAANALKDLETAINNDLASRISSYQAAHPGVTIITRSARANLYTAMPSPYHPSDSLGPTYMDDWEVGDPGCSATAQGQPCTTAYEWRYRLMKEIQSKFPSTAKNIILIGHSTGGRVAMEVAANVGAGGVGTQNWGVQSRIAGVVSLHGMIDGLQSSKYNVAGANSFVTTCKYGDMMAGFGDSCAPGNGWCEYAGNVSGSSAADWVNNNKRAMQLISYASCSPALWTGWSDGALPFDAQGGSRAVGLNMTAAPGQTYRPAHGIKYGSFCHSAISNGNDANHTTAVSNAKTRILDWIFNSAPRTQATTQVTTATLAYGQTSSTYGVGSTCPTGESDGGVSVTGVCQHPGSFDGDDHIVASSELTITDGTTCNGAFKWTQRHDTNNSHAAVLWGKTYSQPAAKSLISIMAPN